VKNKMKNPEENPIVNTAEFDAQGPNASKTFSGEAREISAVREMYGESADLFAHIFEKEFDRLGRKSFGMADLGAHKGDLLRDVLARLSRYNIETIAIERDSNVLNQNDVADRRICADLKRIPLPDGSVDVAFMRYVLQWNEYPDQEMIVSELNRIIRDMAIIQHLGPDNSNANKWRDIVHKILDGKMVPILKRDRYLFSSCEEVEAIFKKLRINFERVQERMIQDLSETFITKFDLHGRDADTVRDVLRGSDYIMQTAFVIRK